VKKRFVPQLMKANGQMFNDQMLTLFSEDNPPPYSYGNGSGGGGRGGKGIYGKPLSSAEKQWLEDFLSQCYDPSNKLLNLDGAVGKAQEMNFQIDFHNKNLVNELANIISNKCVDVVTINFANNNIHTLDAFRYLHKNAVNLKHLSLAHNQLAELAELDNLQGFSSQLEELILSHNPCATNVSSAANTLYRHSLKSKFPALRLLDDCPARQIIEFDLPHVAKGTKVPEPVGSFFQEPDILKTAEAFVTKYFGLYDNNRQELVKAYADSSTFSMMVSKSTRDGSLPACFQENSRNLLTLKLEEDSRFSSNSSSSSSSSSSSTEAALSTRIQKSPLHIVSFLDGKLPRTQHDLTNIICDVFIVPTTQGAGVLLHLAIRGMFNEPQSNTSRCFHRVFLLSPSAGDWPAQVVCDQLYISNRAIANSAPPAQVNAAPDQQQQQMIAAMCQAAGVDQNLAHQYLEQYNWNYDAAGQALVQLKQSQN